MCDEVCHFFGMRRQDHSSYLRKAGRYPGRRFRPLLALRSEAPSCRLLLLPTEIRLAIYDEILSSNRDRPYVLHACRQVNMEARDSLYKRALVFDSQQKLFAWIAKSREANLGRVRRLTLRLTDIDLASLLKNEERRGEQQPTIWSLYTAEFERLQHSLTLLSNASMLTVIPPKIGRSTLLRSMYRDFLSEIPKRCTKLAQLELCDSDCSILDEVPGLRVIRNVKFTAAPKRPRRSPRTAPETYTTTSKVTSQERSPVRVKREPRRSSRLATSQRY